MYKQRNKKIKRTPDIIKTCHHETIWHILKTHNVSVLADDMAHSLLVYCIGSGAWAVSYCQEDSSAGCRLSWENWLRQGGVETWPKRAARANRGRPQ